MFDKLFGKKNNKEKGECGTGPEKTCGTENTRTPEQSKGNENKKDNAEDMKVSE